ncbi:PLP-dependent cysteine synthase family protein [Nocardioides jejuensis]|uniref:L-cysteine desulfhydrase Cds1 n=1 Tax=Nocardioides jejuensis TaxID=2502782 RepID=A0A4R1C1M0_9ACTN|nr:PLP-dependent cysteine synthase family protein [Nocardioides jejuensis]TCJ24364.1 PLP-dependent cysteine synthase family protein [Nocardioides jejuensis]
MSRAWVAEAVRRVEADANRSADTHLHVFPLPPSWGIDLYLKDESVHPTGSLKHRLARSLFLYGLCNGWISSGTTVVDASSGSTAVSEAYFARLLGLPFIAVMPAATSVEKISLIAFYGGEVHLVDDPASVYEEARALAESVGGHYLDQFTYAERATDWRGNNNIAESILSQMSREPHPVPAWVVVGAGTGGTSATIGRYLRYQQLPTQLCVVDPEGSAFYESWVSGSSAVTACGSRIEGIGRPRVEPSFVPGVVDRMLQVPDAASIAAMRWCSSVTGRLVGASTGTSLWGALQLVAAMRAAGEQGSVVTLICDGGERYAHTYYSDAWLEAQGIDPAPYVADLEALLSS